LHWEHEKNYCSVKIRIFAYIDDVFILLQPPGNKKLSQLKHFEPIQSQEVLNIIPGSDATTTINSIDTDKHRRSQSLDYRQVC
jgi:hypothetical protein